MRRRSNNERPRISEHGRQAISSFRMKLMAEKLRSKVTEFANVFITFTATKTSIEP